MPSTMTVNGASMICSPDSVACWPLPTTNDHDLSPAKLNEFNHAELPACRLLEATIA